MIISIAAISFVIFSGDDTENITERTEEYTEESSENRYELSEEPTMRPNSTTQTAKRPFETTRPPATSNNIEVVTGDMDGPGWSDF